MICIIFNCILNTICTDSGMRGSKYNPASFKISGIADVFEQRINFDEAIDSNNEIPKVSNLEGNIFM